LGEGEEDPILSNNHYLNIFNDIASYPPDDPARLIILSATTGFASEIFMFAAAANPGTGLNFYFPLFRYFPDNPKHYKRSLKTRILMNIDP